MIREYVIETCKGYLGSKWVRYGLEMTETADKVLERINTIDCLEGYIRVTLSNAIKQSYRKARRTSSREVPLEVYHIDKITYDQQDSDGIHSDLDAKKALSPDLMLIMRLRYRSGYTIHEIADETGHTIKEVRGRLGQIQDYLTKY